MDQPTATSKTHGPSMVHASGQAFPHNHDAEMAVLGSMLIDPSYAVEVAVGKLSAEGAFHKREHQIIFDAVKDLGNEGNRSSIDMLTLLDYLSRRDKLAAAGGRTYLAQVVNSVPTAANVEQYVEIVLQTAILRRLIMTCIETANRCFDPDEDIRTLLDGIESELLAVTGLNETNELQTVSDLYMSVVQYLERLRNGEKDALGLPTGYDELDRLITGLRPGEMIVVAARPSIGKTALALNIAANLALSSDRVPIGIFSLEMPAEQLVVRLLCSDARIGVTEIREGAMSTKRWGELVKASQRLKEATIVIDDTGGIDVLELKSKARRMKREHDIRVLFIDYMQLVQVSGINKNANRENEVSRISGAVKALAKELSIPVVVLAQLNRQAEQQGQHPKLSHLRESGAIEQDADVVCLLHRNRDEQTERDARQGSGNEGLDAELIVAKNRNGETGRVELVFLPAYTRFETKSRYSDEDARR